MAQKQYYTPTGKSFWADDDISDDELDEMYDELEPAAPVSDPVAEAKEFLGRTETPAPITEPDSKSLWDRATTPLTDAPSRAARAVSPKMGFYGPATEFLGDLASDFTSPLGAASTLLGPPGKLARYAPKIAQVAHNIGRTTSGLFGLHGAGEVVREDATMPERFMGGIEALLGGLGARMKLKPTGLNQVADTVTDVRPKDIELPSAVPETVPVSKPFDVTTDTMTTGQPPVSVKPEKGSIFEALEEGRKSQPKVVLPKDLAGAKPRFNIGQNSYNPIFENDIDKALYIIAQKTPSKRNADYMRFLQEATGLNEKELFEMGQNHRQMIKSMVQGAESGDVQIPKMFDYLTEGRPPVSVPTPEVLTGPASATARPNIDRMRERVFHLAEKGDKLTPQETRELTRLAARVTAANAPAKPKVKLNLDGTFSPVDRPDVKVSKEGKILSKPAETPPNVASSPNVTNLPDEASMKRQIYDLARGALSTDLPGITSAALRQALPHVGTRNWFKAWIPQAKAFGSDLAVKAHMDEIKSRELFAPKEVKLPSGEIKKLPSIAEDSGLRLIDGSKYSKREEAMRTGLAEKIPGFGKWVKASNRSYGAFLNDLRANAFQDLYNDAKEAANSLRKVAKNQKDIDAAHFANPENNAALRKEIAEFVNNSTGAGSLKFSESIDLEKASPFLTDLMFSARNTASRLQMVNPTNYVNQNPEVRKAYLKGLLRTGAFWLTSAGVSQFMPETSVGLNPTSADFGKIKIGNTRYDPGGGFQQFLVLLARQAAGGTTSSTNPDAEFKPFGEGFKAESRGSTLSRFAANKLHPTVRFAYDLAMATKNNPVDIPDRLLQTYIPLIVQDVIEISQDDPSIAKLLGSAVAISAGVGGQTYEKDFGTSKFFDSPLDFSGGSSMDPRKINQFFPKNVSGGNIKW